MSRYRLHLFNFASVGLCEEVERALLHCGFSTLRQSGSQWFEVKLGSDPLPPIVLFDFGWSGAPSPKEVERRRPSGPWIGLFAGGCHRLARQCLDFLLWPVSPEELEMRLGRVIGGDRDSADERLTKAFANFNIVGESAVFRKTLARVERIAQSTAPVLIEGETGTGKELIASAIHYTGPRHHRAYIAVNCGAIPDGLVESEFFGHKRGAFTDARDKRIGVVEQAAGGTLLLDEVEELSPKGQVTLLRLLQEQEFRPVGSDVTKRADVRFIAASNASLDELVRDGSFRRDLFYRLAVLSIEVPPLRDRPEDIEPLVWWFLSSLRSRYGGPTRTLRPSTLDWMRRYEWPGNVRELENLLHRAYVVSEGATLELAERRIEETYGCPAWLEGDFRTAKARVVERFEREYLTWLMTTSGGNVTRAARRAGKERRALGKLLRRHGIDRTAF